MSEASFERHAGLAPRPYAALPKPVPRGFGLLAAGVLSMGLWLILGSAVLALLT